MFLNIMRYKYFEQLMRQKAWSSVRPKAATDAIELIRM